MRAILNRQMFTTRIFDSGSLGPLASAIHQFPEPGRYQVVVTHKGTPTRTAWFDVSDTASNLQLDVDLASGQDSRPSTGNDDDCGCGLTATAITTPVTDVPAVSPKGYVLFFASRGDGYAARVGRQGSDKPAFDSTALQRGDLYAVSLLAPTKYAMTNRAGKAKGTIVVSPPGERARTIASVEAIAIDCDQTRFTPSDVKAISGQGLVFRVVETSRIVIEQIGEPEEASKRDTDVGRRRRFVAQRVIRESKTAR